MGLRIGFGFRLARHVWVGASTPVFGPARHVVRHQGHAEPFDPISFVIGLAILWAVVRTCWGLVTGE
jgi:hypothetical protein